MSATFDKTRTLIVEDDASTCTALQWIIDRMGHEVDHARTLTGAMDKLAWSPNCIVLDLMLPDGNGVELLRRIREQGFPVHVAVTTGMSEPDILAQVRALNPDALMNKPIKLAELERWLANCGR